MQDGVPARCVAYNILNDILFQRQNMDIAFSRAKEFEELESRDRGFVRLLVTLVLKRTMQMDMMLAEFLRDPIDSLKPRQLVNVFRIGLAQLVFLKTPPHAVVNTTVALTEAVGIAHHKPLVNAVMRRLTEAVVPDMSSPDAGKINTPDWLWRAWVKDYGEEIARDITMANLDPAPVDFTVVSDVSGWAEKLEAEVLPTKLSLRREMAGFVPALPGFEDGAWWVQNAAAAIPAHLFGDIKGKTVIDLCAAPGGKTAQLISMGANVTAVDRSAPRMERLRENMERLNLDVEIEIADGGTWQPKEKVDAVLLDAPCTTTGTIRHQPDILHLKGVKDQEKMAALQRKLMVNAFEMLKPGGVLLYCTCSLQKAEGEAQTQWFLQQGLQARLSPVTQDDVSGIKDMLTPDGEIRCLPTHWQDKGGIDGFYVARFLKT